MCTYCEEVLTQLHSYALIPNLHESVDRYESAVNTYAFVDLSVTYCTVSCILPHLQWPNSGGGIENRREVHSQNCMINEKNVPKLKLKWRFITGHTNFSDVTATPSISDGFVYFPDWAGFLYAVHRDNGTLAWKTNLTNVTGTGAFGTVFSKHTPQESICLLGFSHRRSCSLLTGAMAISSGRRSSIQPSEQSSPCLGPFTEGREVELLTLISIQKQVASWVIGFENSHFVSSSRQCPPCPSKFRPFS